MRLSQPLPDCLKYMQWYETGYNMVYKREFIIHQTQFSLFFFGVILVHIEVLKYFTLLFAITSTVWFTSKLQLQFHFTWCHKTVLKTSPPSKRHQGTISNCYLTIHQLDGLASFSVLDNHIKTSALIDSYICHYVATSHPVYTDSDCGSTSQSLAIKSVPSWLW